MTGGKTISPGRLPKRSVAVFCGSRPGHDPAWAIEAAKLGRALGAAGWRLVYGGGRLGLMGVLADAALAEGGEVIGVIPRFLVEREVAHDALSERIETDGLHARKQRMLDLADAFITLPGGFGTFDETIEIITWRLLGVHRKPIFICNVGGWADGLLATFDRARAQGFADALGRETIQILPDAEAVVTSLALMLAETAP